jgi:hypothetical protein
VQAQNIIAGSIITKAARSLALIEESAKKEEKQAALLLLPIWSLCNLRPAQIIVCVFKCAQLQNGRFSRW